MVGNHSRVERLGDGDLILEASDAAGEPHIVPLVITRKLKPGYRSDHVPGIVVQLRPSTPLVAGRTYILRENPERPEEQRDFTHREKLAEYQVISSSPSAKTPSNQSAPLHFLRERLQLTIYSVRHSLEVKIDKLEANWILLLAKDSSGRSILSYEQKNPTTPTSITLSYVNDGDSCLFADPNWSPLKTVEAIAFLPHGEIGDIRSIEVKTNPLTTSVLASLARLRGNHDCSNLKEDDMQVSK